MPSADSLRWHAYPMWRLLLPYLVGLILADQCNYQLLESGVWAVFLLLSLGLVFFLPRRTSFRWRLWLGLGILCWVLTLGYLRISQQYAPHRSTHLSAYPALWEYQMVYASGRIIDQRPGSERLRLTLALDLLQCHDSLRAINAKVALSLPLNTAAHALNLGNRLAFRGRIRPIRPPTNPNVFDYAAWQARQQVFHQVYLQADDWQQLDSRLSLRGWAEGRRAALLRILHHYLGDQPNEYAVAAALVLGKRDAISQELRNAFAETGAVHVLAVSGLHVGFVLGALQLLLGWGFWRKPRWRWLRLSLILLGIWLFALLTGLAPSVLRAATMFSFLAIGSHLQRKGSTYNALAASAFLLLLINPQLLWNIGFQLSYLAVLGILFFQPRIERSVYFSHQVARKGWTLLSVAIAAQLTTFPLSLYYFHQFPVYFLLTGLFVVLLAAGILYLAMALLLLSWWTGAATLLAKGLYWLLFLNNALIFGVQSLPFGLVRAIWISGAVVIVLYAILFFLARQLRQQHLKPWALLSSVILVLALYNWDIFQRQQQKQAIVYDVRRASAIDWMDGSQAYASTHQIDAATVDYQLRPYREQRGIQSIVPLANQTQLPHLWRHGAALAFRQQRWLLIDEHFKLPAASEPLVVDVVLLRQNPRLELARLDQKIDAPLWVADASNAPWRVRQWQAEADSLSLNFHYTSEDGAYIYSQKE